MSPIQPSGKRKYVKAQGMNMHDLGEDSIFTNMTPGGSESHQGIGKELGSLFDQESAMKHKEEGNPEMGEEFSEMGEQTDTDTDILDYIMKKLEGFGYPPRRLNEYKEEFVSEKLLPGSARDVSITFPDMYYGKGKRLARDEISKIIEEIQQQFDLVFKDGERKDKKVFLNFISKGQEGDGEEEQGIGDELDLAFGGTAEKKPTKNKKASTQQEMMKMSKTNAFEQLQKRG